MCLCLTLSIAAQAKEIPIYSDITGKQQYTIGSNDFKVKFNGEKVDFPDAQPFVDEHNRTLVPLRFVTEKMGAAVTWDENSSTATVEKDGTRVDVTIGSSNIIVTKNGEATTVVMDTKAVLKDGRTFVPVRFVAEALGAWVGYSDLFNTAQIYDDVLTPKEIARLHSYGYLSPKLKSVVDEITDELAKDARVAEAYKLWNEMQNAVINIYTDNLPEPLPLSQQKEFKTVRNMIIREALALSDLQVHTDLDSKEELESDNSATQAEPAVLVNTHQPQKRSYTPQSTTALSISAATRLLYNMGNIFRSTVPMNYNKAQHIDRKRRAELSRLRRTHGVKGNDYEQNM